MTRLETAQKDRSTAFEELLDCFMLDYAPVTVREEDLVREMASSRWRMQIMTRVMSNLRVEGTLRRSYEKACKELKELQGERLKGEALLMAHYGLKNPEDLQDTIIHEFRSALQQLAAADGADDKKPVACSLSVRRSTKIQEMLPRSA
ncbi:MAG: hypothetical protein H7039_14070 [Bryobacteraceae bacterium]|nr:hypothetical protein [Bryobacteraceae bacterium]